MPPCIPSSGTLCFPDSLWRGIRLDAFSSPAALRAVRGTGFANFPFQEGFLQV